MLEERIMKYENITKDPTRALNKIEKEGETLFYYPNMIGICKNSASSVLESVECKIIEKSQEYTIVDIKTLKNNY